MADESYSNVANADDTVKDDPGTYSDFSFHSSKLFAEVSCGYHYFINHTSLTKSNFE
jgi:hypothetical protein